MAKKFKNSEIRKLYMSEILCGFKDKAVGAAFLGIIAVGAGILLDAVKNDEASDDAELFRE